MKKNNPHRRYASGSCLILAILLATALTALGQGTVMEEYDFERVVRRAGKSLSEKAYRERTSIAMYEDGREVSPEPRHRITEVVSPDRSRSVSITNSDGKEQKWESISIGSKEWLRVDDGPWKVDDGPRKIPEISDDVIIRGTITTVISRAYASLGKTKLMGVSMAVYESVLILDHQNEDSSRSTSVDKEKYWIDDAGAIRQIVAETQTVGSKKLERFTRAFEYDPKITIEAPIK